MMKTILITATLLWASVVCASIRLTTGPGADRVGQVTGLSVNLSNPGFKMEGSDSLPDTVLLDKVELMTRDSTANYDKPLAPMFLKVYEDPDRTVYVGSSLNALAWDIGGGVFQTYDFNGLPLNSKRNYYFAFETKSDPRSPLSSAGFRVTEKYPADLDRDGAMRILTGNGLQKPKAFKVSVVSRLSLRPAAGSESSSSGSLLWLAAIPVVLILGGAGAFFALRGKKNATSTGGASLPPPPGFDR